MHLFLCISNGRLPASGFRDAGSHWLPGRPGPHSLVIHRWFFFVAKHSLKRLSIIASSKQSSSVQKNYYKEWASPPVFNDWKCKFPLNHVMVDGHNSAKPLRSNQSTCWLIILFKLNCTQWMLEVISVDFQIVLLNCTFSSSSKLSLQVWIYF